MLSISLSEGKSAIGELAYAWDSFVADSETAAFSSSGWLLAWIDAFNPDKIAIITARENQRLVGILPIARTRTDARGLFFRVVSTLAGGDYRPFILDANLAAMALPKMLEAAMDHFGRTGVYWWPNIPSTDPSLAILRSHLTACGMQFVEEIEMAPRLRLQGTDYEAEARTWPRNHRIDVRRQQKRLAEQGDVTLWQPTTLAEAEAVLEEFFEVHDEKWLAQGYPGKFQDIQQQVHFRSLLKRMWGRGVHFSTVRCGSIHVSYHFGFLAGGWLQWYRPSYRLSFSRYSPSKIHLAMLIEEACRSGWKGIDFLLGTEGYKKQWANEMTEVVSIHSGFSKWAPSYIWFSAGKPFVREKLQHGYFCAKAWVQKLRNQL